MSNVSILLISNISHSNLIIFWIRGHPTACEVLFKICGNFWWSIFYVIAYDAIKGVMKALITLESSASYQSIISSIMLWQTSIFHSIWRIVCMDNADLWQNTHWSCFTKYCGWTLKQRSTIFALILHVNERVQNCKKFGLWSVILKRP